jgi:hypothetical protein
MSTPLVSREDFYIQLPNSLVFDTRMTANTFRVLCSLFTFAGKKSVCWPGQKAIAKDVALSDRQIRNILNKLEGLGLIMVEERPGDTNKYHLYCKVIPKVNHQKSISGEGRNPVSDKLDSTNYSHGNRAYRRLNEKKKGPIDFSKYTGTGKYALIRF